LEFLSLVIFGINLGTETGVVVQVSKASPNGAQTLSSNRPAISGKGLTASQVVVEVIE